MVHTCVHKFDYWVTNENVVPLLLLASENVNIKLKTLCISYISVNFESLKEILKDLINNENSGGLVLEIMTKMNKEKTDDHRKKRRKN